MAVKIDTKKLEKHILSGIKACNEGWNDEMCCIGVTKEGYQVQLKVTRDEDDLMNKPAKRHFCVEGV